MLFLSGQPTLCFLCTGVMTSDEVMDAPVTDWVADQVAHHECASRKRRGFKFNRDLHAAIVHGQMILTH